MRKADPIDRRLSETRPSSPSEALLISVVTKHRSGPAPALPPSALVRIWRTLGERPPRRSAVPMLRAARVFAMVAAALFSVEAVALVGIRVVAIVRGAAYGSSPPAQLPSVRPAAVVESGPRVLPAPPPAPEPEPSPRFIQPHEARPVRSASSPGVAARQSSVPPAPAPTVAAPSAASTPSRADPAQDPLDSQAAQLKHGLELKRAGNLAAAVSALEGYRRAYPKGVFWAEATIAELDAQLSLGHREDALSLLQRVGDNPTLPRSAELRLLRAELSARQGRCAEAMAGFEASLEIPSLAERALYGRATCQQALGQLSASRHDFEDYLSRYPLGSLAAEARRALGLAE